MTTLKQATPPIMPATEGLPPEDQGIIERFKARIAEFKDLFARLVSVRNQVPAELRDEYQALVNRGTTIQNTIDTVTGGINKAVDWFKGAFGLDAVNLAKQGQLGFLPLLPVAAVTGVMGLIGYWVTDTMAFIKRMDVMMNMIERGYTPAEAVKAIKEAGAKPPIFGLDFQKMIVPAAILAGIWWFMRNKGF